MGGKLGGEIWEGGVEWGLSVGGKAWLLSRRGVGLWANMADMESVDEGACCVYSLVFTCLRLYISRSVLITYIHSATIVSADRSSINMKYLYAMCAS